MHEEPRYWEYKLNTIPFLRRIIYKAKMTARPMQFKKGKLDIVKHKS
jgi:hypothetical protein